MGKTRVLHKKVRYQWIRVDTRLLEIKTQSFPSSTKRARRDRDFVRLPPAFEYGSFGESKWGNTTRQCVHKAPLGARRIHLRCQEWSLTTEGSPQFGAKIRPFGTCPRILFPFSYRPRDIKFLDACTSNISSYELANFPNFETNWEWPQLSVVLISPRYKTSESGCVARFRGPSNLSISDQLTDWGSEPFGDHGISAPHSLEDSLAKSPSSNWPLSVRPST